MKGRFFMKDNNDKFFKEDGENDNRLPMNIEAEITPNEESTYTFRWEATKENKTKDKSHAWVNTLIIAISLLVAFSILCFTVIYDIPQRERDETLPSPETQAVQDTEASKTIFIKEYDDTSGILTPQQIYAHALPSVITVKASNDTFEGIGTGFVFDKNGYMQGTNENTVI